MKIGITGVKGLIGQSIFSHLNLKGHSVISLDKYTQEQSLDIDLKNSEEISSLDWVLHFASKTSIELSIKDPFNTYRNNMNSTLIALKIAEKSSASFLFMSSFVYGKANYSPIDENHPTSASNPYMSSKIIGEETARQICKINDLPLIILRASNIYGKNLVPGRLISDLLIAYVEKKPMLLNDPNPKRDYLYIKDFNYLISKIVERSPTLSGTYNVGYGRKYSNLEVAELFNSVIDSQEKIVFTEKRREFEVLDASIEVGLIKRKFNWNPRYTLRDGIKDLINK
jgi:nucleoside-diphosphate-sugar epimerase